MIANKEIATELKPYMRTEEKAGRFWVYWSSRPDTWNPHVSSIGASGYKELRKKGLAGVQSTNDPQRVESVMADVINRIRLFARQTLAVPPMQASSRSSDIREQVTTALGIGKGNGTLPPPPTLLEPVDRVASPVRKTLSGVQPLGAVSELEVATNIVVTATGDAHRATIQVVATRHFLEADAAQHWAHAIAAQIAGSLREQHNHVRTG